MIVPSLWNMHASTIRMWVGSTALALIMARATSVAPEPAAKPPVPAPVSSGNIAARVSLPSVNAPFRLAAARRTSVIDQCFTSNLDTNVPPTPGQIALVSAALKEDWKTVLRLLDAGASVETTDESGTTPLMAAARQGNAEIIRTLLAQGASVDFADLDGRSALHYALRAGKLEAVQLLLPLASNLEATSVAGSDLLTMALETSDMKIFQAVLERFPATLSWAANTRRALETALRADMKEQVRLLLSKHPAPPTREGGMVPLIAYAIANDDAPLFHTLLACGSDPNIVIPKAAEKDFMSLLKSKYLRLYIQEETGINLLMLAAGLGKTDYVRALLDAGADRNRATPHEKMLPLYFAAWTENWQCVQMLLGGGPMPDQLRVEISLAQQNMSVIKDGITVFTTKCSTGRQGFTTKPGQYVITDKDRDHRSTIYKCAMPYFMRLNCRDFGMHEGVVQPYPASHGCIRLPGDAARKLFAEIPVGTVVMIN
jgi:ankyrin repeat protein